MVVGKKGWCDQTVLCQWAMNNLLLLLTLIGVIVGFLLVLIMRPYNPSDDTIMWIGMPGELFLRGLEMTIIPLLVSTVITAVAGLELKENGRMAAWSFFYFVCTTSIGITTGIVMTALIRPGEQFAIPGKDSPEPAQQTVHYQTQDVFADLLRNLIPSNIIRACFQSTFTKYESKEVENTENVNGTSTTTTLTKQLAMTNRTNIMGVVIFCIACGMAMSVERVKTKPLLDFMWALRTVIFKVFGAFIWSLPVATASLIAASLLKVEDLLIVEEELGMFVATVITVLFLHFFASIPGLYFIFTRKNAFKVYGAVNKAIITSMVIKSGAGALPIMMKCCETGREKMHRSVSSFVLPLCVCFKGDASAAFIMCSVLWLGQRAGIFMSMAELIALGIMSTFLCLCIPPIPSASMVIIILICNSVGVPTQDLGLLLALEWLLDSLRTGVNNGSHAMCAATVNHAMRHRFKKKDKVKTLALNSNHEHQLNQITVDSEDNTDLENDTRPLILSQY
uniref:Amino acid transporter n=1 Tax=Saccoglossus kowalevskii TaxID=10224 RepID=A0ABM0MVI4_SACKO|nr:PREDICTED: putative sodium-dependent excitatory amino acid transporter glt-6-like [Saccoglossus kowalevskii]